VVPEPNQIVPPAAAEPEQVAPSKPEQGTAPATSEAEQTAAPSVPRSKEITTPATAKVEQVAVPTASEPERIAGPEPEQAVASAVLEPEKSDASSTPESKQFAAPATLELEVSTHTPVTFSSKASKAGSSEHRINGNGVLVPPAPGGLEPVAAAPAAIDDKPETLAGSLNTTELPPTAPQAEGSPALTKNEKHEFPGSEKDEGDGTSSKTGGSSLRKKRHSMFGKASKGDDGDSSKYGSTPRKNTRSFFGKVKHLFDHKGRD
jgi:hypothetical protein